MSRVAVCLLLITIFQNGIEADNSTETSPESPSKAENASSTEPANKEEATVSKTDKEQTPDVAEAKEGKKDKTKKSEHEKKSATAPDVSKIARSKISDAVSKGMDGAKDMADGAFNFFRDTVTSFF